MSKIRTYRVNHAMQMISIPLHSTTNSYHFGNNREVVGACGAVTQVTNYYPFGAPYADASASKGADVQPYKYNGKELDLMHGLNTYDYGARQYNPVTARWDRIDPLCEKYYSTSPYAYCANNPINHIDVNGMYIGDYYDMKGNFLATDGKIDGKTYMVTNKTEVKNIKKTKDVSNVSSAMPTPSNSQVNKGQEIIDQGQKTQQEAGFVMGNDGSTSKILTGNTGTVNLGEGYKELGDKAQSDAHYHPFDFRVINGAPTFSTSEPSSADTGMRTSRENSKLNNPNTPSWVIGEEPNGPSTLNPNGSITPPSTTTSIRFVYGNERVSEPYNWNSFKKAVYKINGQ